MLLHEQTLYTLKLLLWTWYVLAGSVGSGTFILFEFIMVVWNALVRFIDVEVCFPMFEDPLFLTVLIVYK